MPVSTLKLTQVRNFTSAVFEFSPDINLIVGANGSGKTTILESLYVLGTGRSFRTTQLSNMIQKTTQGSSIEAGVNDGSQGSEPVLLKMRKKQQEQTEYFISQQTVKSVSELVKLMPVQLLNLHGYLLLEDAPEQRRKFMDWMMFHVEHSFLSIWQTFQRTLRQRNALLKMRAPRHELLHWTNLLAEIGESLHQMRAQVVQRWIDYAKPQCHDLPGVFNMNIHYKAGWAAEQGTYAQALDEGLQRDMAIGHTHRGPHRADLHITVDGVNAEHMLSTGQQKTFVSMLQIMQTEWMIAECQRTPILLIDDLPSELDLSARALLAAKISGLQAQVFMSSVDKQGFQPFIQNRNYRMFHVEHGVGKVV